MLEMNARSLQQKLETERELKQRLLEEVSVEHLLNGARRNFEQENLLCLGGQVQTDHLSLDVQTLRLELSRKNHVVTKNFLEGT